MADNNAIAISRLSVRNLYDTSLAQRGNLFRSIAKVFGQYRTRVLADAIRALDDLDDASLKGLLRRVVARIFNELAFEGFCREAEQQRHSTTTTAAAQPG